MFLGPKIIICADFLGVCELNVKLIFGICFPVLRSLVSEVTVFQRCSEQLYVFNSHIYATCVHLFDRVITALQLSEEYQLYDKRKI